MKHPENCLHGHQASVATAGCGLVLKFCLLAKPEWLQTAEHSMRRRETPGTCSRVLRGQMMNFHQVVTFQTATKVLTLRQGCWSGGVACTSSRVCSRKRPRDVEYPGSQYPLPALAAAPVAGHLILLGQLLPHAHLDC